jgi:hypothetical protein
MTNAIKKAQDYKPHPKSNPDFQPHPKYEPKYGEEEHVEEALGHVKKLHEIYDKTGNMELTIASELKSSAGKDYLDEMDSDKIDAIAKKLRKLASDMVIGDNIGQEEASESLKDFVTYNLIKPFNDLSRRMEKGDRVSFGEIDNIVAENFQSMRRQLAEPIYTELRQHDKYEVAQEVASMLHYYIGGADAQSRVDQVGRHKTAQQVVQDDVMGLERDVSMAYQRMHRGSKVGGSKGGKDGKKKK